MPDWFYKFGQRSNPVDKTSDFDKLYKGLKEAHKGMGENASLRFKEGRGLYFKDSAYEGVASRDKDDKKTARQAKYENAVEILKQAIRDRFDGRKIGGLEPEEYIFQQLAKEKFDGKRLDKQYLGQIKKLVDEHAPERSPAKLRKAIKPALVSLKQTHGIFYDSFIRNSKHISSEYVSYVLHNSAKALEDAATLVASRGLGKAANRKALYAQLHEDFETQLIVKKRMDTLSGQARQYRKTHPESAVASKIAEEELSALAELRSGLIGLIQQTMSLAKALDVVPAEDVDHWDRTTFCEPTPSSKESFKATCHTRVEGLGSALPKKLDEIPAFDGHESLQAAFTALQNQRTQMLASFSLVNKQPTAEDLHNMRKSAQRLNNEYDRIIDLIANYHRFGEIDRQQFVQLDDLKSWVIIQRREIRNIEKAFEASFPKEEVTIGFDMTKFSKKEIEKADLLYHGSPLTSR